MSAITFKLFISYHSSQVPSGMFVKLTVTFLVIFPLHDCNSHTAVTDNDEPERTVKIPQSLIEEMLKKQDDLEGIKELLRLVSSTTNSTAAAAGKPTTTQPESVYCPIRRLIIGIRKLVANLKKRIKEARVLSDNGTLVTKGPFKSKKIIKLMYILKGLQSDLELVKTAGRDIKKVWNLLNELLNEDDDRAVVV